MTYVKPSQQKLPEPSYFVCYNPSTLKIVGKSQWAAKGKISTLQSVCVTSTFADLQIEIAALKLVGDIGEDPTV